MIFTDLKEILSLLQTFVVPILGYGLYRLNRIDDTLLELRDHLAKLNGRVSTCYELREAHEQSDRDRHENCEDRLRDVEKSLLRTKHV
ncbi:MAG: hypothetical protein KGK17_01000 [Betaproteobacteria bacterium]|nr:hypothetical protein [Betaproteobacteria bacterium]